MIGFALELDRADEIAAGPGGEPALDQRQEPRRVADDIRKQPIDRADRARVEREGAVQPVLDPGQARDCRRQRRLVDADDMRPQCAARPSSSRRGCCRDRDTSRPARAGTRLRSAPPKVSDRRGSAARCGLRQSGSRRSETRWCSAVPPASSRHRAGSMSRAGHWAAAFRRRAALRRPWAAVLGSRRPAGRVWRHRAPSCAGLRAVVPPRRISRRF